MVWRPEVEDFIEAHEAAGKVSELGTPGLKMSTEKGIQKIMDVIRKPRGTRIPTK